MGTVNRIIITGAPGTGKSSLIKAFITEGFQCFQDVARELITEGNIPPVWDRDQGSGFGEMVLNARIAQFKQAQKGRPVFYDRALPDGLIFSKFLKRRAPTNLIDAVRIHRYSTSVFVLPPWKGIFVKDEVRKESFADIQELHELTIDIYNSEGYECVIVPEDNVGERVKFILAYLGNLR